MQRRTIDSPKLPGRWPEVLVVEDELDIRRLVVLHLERDGALGARTETHEPSAREAAALPIGPKRSPPQRRDLQ